MQTTHDNSDRMPLVNKRARGQLGALTTMFLLGMAVNLIDGFQSSASGTAKTATAILLGLHVLVGIGLLVGGTVILLRARSSAFYKQAQIGLAAIILTFLFGVMTAITQNNWWSYAMSVGFIANFWIYGVLFVKTRPRQ